MVFNNDIVLMKKLEEKMSSGVELTPVEQLASLKVYNKLLASELAFINKELLNKTE